MKKLNTILSLLFLGIGIYILIGSYIKTKPVDDLKVYSVETINEYRYEDNQEYEISYFTNSIIEDKEYYIRDINKKLILSNYRESYSKTIYSNEEYYRVTIHFKIDSPISFNNLYLEIINSEYNIELYLGTLNIIELNDNKIDINYIESHYSYINNNLILVGISIKLNEDVLVNSITINDNTYIQIQNIYELDKKLDNIIKDYKFNIHDKSNETINLKKDKLYFLPCGYNRLAVNKRFNITINNDIKLYLPSLFISKLEPNDYLGFVRRGEIVKNN